MNQSNEETLRQALWRGAPTAAQVEQLRQRIAAGDCASEDWRLETALNDALNVLPAPPLASNFTARVLAGLDPGPGATRPGLRWLPAGWGSMRRLVPRLAVALALVALGTVALWQHRQQARREIAYSLAGVNAIAPVPDLDMLRDFEAIHQLKPAPTVDVALLAALDPVAFP